MLEEEVTELLGRSKSERSTVVDAPAGYRNGHGKPRRLSMMAGTIEVKRPRVRGISRRWWITCREPKLSQERSRPGTTNRAESGGDRGGTRCTAAASSVMTSSESGRSSSNMRFRCMHAEYAAAP